MAVSHLGVPILTIFDLQVAPICPSSVQLNCFFGSEEVQIDYQDGSHS